MLRPHVKRLTELPKLSRGFVPLLCAALVLPPVHAEAAPPKSQPAEAEDAAEDEAPPEDPNYERAVEAYRRGTELYNEAKFEEALEAFQEAATLYASPDFQFNIAKCYERLNKYEDAIRSYELYLRTAEDSGDRAVIEASITDLKRRIEERDAAAAEANKDPEPDPDTGPKKPPGRALVIAGGALLGVGAAVALGGGLGFGIPVSRDNAILGEVADGNPDRLTFAEADALADQARQNQTLELVMIGVGGALVLTGAVLLGVGMSKKKKANTARLQVAPTWGRTGAGLTLSGRF
jgi:tetratricopeptide (TPR) repeat protein